MWNSLSGSLSNYLHPPSIERASSSSTTTVDNPPTTPSRSALERVNRHVDSTKSEINYSPNSLSASGNQIMAGVLAAHPQFSVFRKSATSPRDSSGSSSFHLSSLEGADLPSLNFGDHSSSASLVPCPSPSPSSPSQPTTGGGGGVRLIPDSPPPASNRLESSRETDHPIISPPPPPPPPPPSRTPSRSSSSSSLSKSQSGGVAAAAATRRVGQFSPLSLCPSPLIGAPTLPPPPPAPLPLLLESEGQPRDQRDNNNNDDNDYKKQHDHDRRRRTLSGGGGSIGILKLPRTPGTGRSVRFTESIIDHGQQDVGVGVVVVDRSFDEDESDQEEEGFEREESPSILPGSRRKRSLQQAGVTIQRFRQMEEEEEDVTESALDFSAMTSKEGGGGGAHSSSFLNKLQQVIPSPDTSLVDPRTEIVEVEQHQGFEEEEGRRTEPVDGQVESVRQDVSSVSPSTTTTIHPCSSSSSSPSRQQHRVSSFSSSSFSSISTIQPLERSSSSLNRSSTKENDDTTSNFSNLVVVAANVNADDLSYAGNNRKKKEGEMLFDESNPPFFFNQSMSVLGGSTTLGGGGGLGVGGGGIGETRPMESVTETEEEEEEEDQVELPPFTTGTKTPRKSSFLARDHLRDSMFEDTPTTLTKRSRIEEEEEEVEDARSLRDSTLRKDELDHSTISTSTSSDPSPRAFDTTAHVVPTTPSSSSEDVVVEERASSSGSVSFYRKFMESRARSGGSRTAVEEWQRLETGEKSSPKDQQQPQQQQARTTTTTLHPDEVVVEIERQEEEENVRDSVLPRSSLVKAEEQEEEEEEEEEEKGEIERVFVQGGSFYELAPETDDDEEAETGASMVDYGGLTKTFLSPIVELSEPESSYGSPPIAQVVASLKRSRPSPVRNSATSSSSTRPASSVDVSLTPPRSVSKIPRPRNPITPSRNPFLLQLSRTHFAVPPSASTTTTTTTTTTGERCEQRGIELIQELLSTREAQVETDSSQRSLLSSLVTNLRLELDRKDLVVENLKRQVLQARTETRQVEQVILEWQQTRRRFDDEKEKKSQEEEEEEEEEGQVEREKEKVVALEETVQLLVDELETRLKENGSARKRIEARLEHTRKELIERDQELRNTEIRLRHARSDQEQLEGEVGVMRERERLALQEASESRNQVEMLRVRWQAEAEDRERTTRKLRQEIDELKQPLEGGGGGGGTNFEERIEKEVAKRVEEVKRQHDKEALFVRQELVLRDAALADLRIQLRAAQDEARQTRGLGQEDRQQAELAFADLESRLSSTAERVEQLEETNAELQDELDETTVKFEDANIDRERLIRLLEAKEVELAQQHDECDTAITAMRDLEAAVTRFESEAATRMTELGNLKTQLELQKSMLEKREGVLAESEKAVSRLQKERGVLELEKDKAVAFSDKLKRDSADREIRISKLKKRIAELDEDVFGLNIALDAKQQEASHWKRQMSQLKLERAQSASATVPPTTARRSTMTTAKKTTSAVAGTSSVLAGLEHLDQPEFQQQQGTPYGQSKKHHRQLSRRSSRPRLASSESRSIEHDLTLPDPDDTPSRLPPATNTAPSSTTYAAPSSAGAGGVRKSSSVSNLRPIQFPNVPTTGGDFSSTSASFASRDRLGAMANLGVGVASIEKRRSSTGYRSGSETMSKENEPPLLLSA